MGVSVKVYKEKDINEFFNSAAGNSGTIIHLSFQVSMKFRLKLFWG